MKVSASALKRGVSEDDILHALRNYQLVYPSEGDHQVAMFIGPAIDGTVLEIGVVEDDDDPRVIHAMKARSKYWPPARR